VGECQAVLQKKKGSGRGGTKEKESETQKDITEKEGTPSAPGSDPRGMVIFPEGNCVNCSKRAEGSLHDEGVGEARCKDPKPNQSGCVV